ncbi:MAG TPA: hypothetical protein VMU42_01910 [Candidatus Sulfotelmatobacter sp.]|nr:hypothetical protein [Candidatus Sulfotelmatobacter sp.]
MPQPAAPSPTRQGRQRRLQGVVALIWIVGSGASWVLIVAGIHWLRLALR